MNLEKHTKFQKLFEKDSRPTKGEVRQMVLDGDLPGRVIGSNVYVDINRFIGQASTVQASTTPDLLS